MSGSTARTLLRPTALLPGAVVGVADERGKFLGTALYSSASQIAIRMISKEAVKDLDGLLRRRIRDAIAYRERVVRDTDAYRIVFSEADFLPGLIVDRYNDSAFAAGAHPGDGCGRRCAKTVVSELDAATETGGNRGTCRSPGAGAGTVACATFRLAAG